ncbi:MAG: transglutaminase family protein [Acidimicrobiales bacterium]
MRLDIRYRMLFEYDSPVREAHNELRVRPRDLPEQRLLAHRLTSIPASRILSYTDYWGTTIDHLGVVFQHEEFEIVAEAAVETRTRQEPETCERALLADQAFRLANFELLRPSPHVSWNDEIADIAMDVVGSTGDAVSAVQATVAATRELLTYERNSTSIGIELTELVAGGRGVCQDYAHLNIGLLRAAGIPARYVSGYLFAVDETDIDDEAHIASVQTHAWVEAGLPGDQWMPVDPTNDQPVGERHVVIGFGRDYDDVAPVRGVYAGEGVPSVAATVEMRRMEPVERTMSPRPRRPAKPIPYIAMSDPARAQDQQQQQQ